MSAQTASILPSPGGDAAAHRARTTGVLLEPPRWRGDSTMRSTAYVLRGGAVRAVELVDYVVPAAVLATTRVGPARENPDALAVLDLLAREADRVAPWLEVHVVPTIYRRKSGDFERYDGAYQIDGDDYSRAGGLAPQNASLILLELAKPTFMLTALYHEIFHRLWRHVSTDYRDRLTAALTSVVEWPGDYYSDPEERACRAFESYASGRLEGLPPPGAGDDLLGLLEDVYDGSFADAVLAAGHRVPDADALRARRGVALLPPPAPPPAPPRLFLDRAVDAWLAAAAMFTRLLQAVGLPVEA